MIAILDIGKTNKKCFVFDEDYRVVFETTATLPETSDEDGDPCEDLDLLTDWVLKSVRTVVNDARFSIRAIHCAAYGASLVHLDADGQPLTPLYNYLKPFPGDLQKRFFDRYGGAEKIALETASPVLGHLNSGLQLYRLKHHKSLVFNKIKYTLHLPQYVSFLIKTALGDLESPAVRAVSEITGIGCHTMLWDFRKNDYHDWVKTEGLAEKFPPIRRSGSVVSISRPAGQPIRAGIGLHDSSAALIPYSVCFDEPFLLLSTGTWCISLNPFNEAPLTPEELTQDCLCYLGYDGKPVKAARFFGGYEHEQAVKRLAAVSQDSESLEFSEHYRVFMRQLVEKQAVSTGLALGDTSVRRIFVDGGFAKNKRYMTLLAQAFPALEVWAAEVAQAAALGAAMAIHAAWNRKPPPANLIALQQY